MTRARDLIPCLVMEVYRHVLWHPKTCIYDRVLLTNGSIFLNIPFVLSFPKFRKCPRNSNDAPVRSKSPGEQWSVEVANSSRCSSKQHTPRRCYYPLLGPGTEGVPIKGAVKRKLSYDPSHLQLSGLLPQTSVWSPWSISKDTLSCAVGLTTC